MSGPALDFTDPTGMPALAALFLFGLLGSGHCIGMCGGIVTALHRHRASIPIVPVERAATTCKPGGLRDQLAWNVGRLTSYALAGALAGTVGSAVWLVEHVLPVQRIAFVLTSLVMFALGLQMLGVTAVGAALERAGRWFWPIMRPAARSSLRLTGLPGALAVGVAWGWVPCGMVYGALGLAIVSGSAASGAGVMLAFGLGTLPALLGLGWAGKVGAARFDSLRLRRAAGGLIILFAIAGLARLDPISGLRQLGELCLSWTR